MMAPAGAATDRARPGTVLVTGATGFMGASLAASLLASGAQVRVLARTPAKGRRLGDRGAQVVVGDIADPAAVSAAVDGAEVVYHLAGQLLAPGVPAAVYQRVNIDGTRVLLDCCRKAPGVRRFVHCSSTGVLGVTGDRPADEEAPICPTNIYEATKAEAELLVREAWRDGFPAVIARPGLVYGPGDLHLLPFFQAILRGWFRPVGRRKVWLHPIYIEDMTEALVRCGQRDVAIGECFHLAGFEPAHTTQLAGAIARAGGTRVPPGHIPVFAARAAAAFGDRLPPGVKKSVALTSSRLDLLTNSRMYDVSKAARLLGFTAPTDLSTGAARSIAWYRQQGFLPAARCPG